MKKSAIVGFVRYSCVYPPDHYNHNAEYFSYRFNIFKNVTLRSLQEQTDKDFQVFILHSVDLPQECRQKFSDLEKSNPFLHNVYMQNNWEDFIDKVMSSRKYVRFINEVSVNFRLDNDDALPRNFISRLRKFLRPEFAGYCVSIPRISIVQRVSLKKFLIKDNYAPANSMGLAYVTTKQNYQTIMQLAAHSELYQKYPLILILGQGGLQTINGNNLQNTLGFGCISAYSVSKLKDFFGANNYPLLDLQCLKVRKRRQWLEFMVKVIDYISYHLFKKYRPS
jgi:hypothetical protein